MDMAPSPNDIPEHDTAPVRRRAKEAEMLAEAYGDAAAARLVSLKDVEAWVESWESGHELPPPSSHS
jgi:hypothetical protein